MTPTRCLSLVAALAVAVLGVAGPAAAHTVGDVVAVPAGAEATVTLQPGHGCGDSPTVAVSIRAPMRGATAGAVDGWTATATEDEDGTVLDWSGGVLPTDQVGRFPVVFTAPDAPGELLTFPSVQMCENGEELAWISGDPAAEYPAPRLLVLPPDAAAAATVDDVPPDAPGREQLVDIVDVDAPGGSDAAGGSDAGEDPGAGSAGATTPPAGGGASAPDTGSADGATGDAAAETDTDTDTDDDTDDEGGSNVIAGVVVLAVVAGVAAVVFLRRRSPRAP